MTEVLDRIETLSQTDHRKSGYVVFGVEQVFAMRRGVHEHVLKTVHGFGNRNIFSGAIQMQVGGLGNALREGRLARKLMRELLLVSHGLIMGRGGGGETIIGAEGRNTGSGAGLVGQVEELSL